MQDNDSGLDASPLAWPRRWARREPFWQGIAIQAIGTLISAFIILVFAVIAGVGYDPATRALVLNITLMILLFIFAFFVLGAILEKFMYPLFNKYHRLAEYHRTILGVAGVIAGVLFVVVLYFVPDLINEFVGYNP